jgi:flagellar basal body-associated protein FliL
MLKLNLLQAKPIQAAGDVQEIKESDILTDESFLDQEAGATSPVVEVEEEAVAPTPEPETETPETVEEPEQPEFEFKSKSRLPIVPILVGLLLIGVVAGYFWVSKKPQNTANKPVRPEKASVAEKSTQAKTGGEHPPTVESAGKTQPATTPSHAESASQKEASTPVPVEANAQRQAGVQAVSVFGQVLSSVEKGTRIGFLSFDGDAFTLELFATQQSRLEKFLQNVKGAIPGFSYKILAKDRSYYQGRTMPHLLISGQLSASGTVEPGMTTLTSGTIRKNLRELAVSHRVRIRELRMAAPVTNTSKKRVRVTLKVSGAQNAIQAFLSDLLNRYANLGVSRLFVSAAKSGAAGQLDVAADLNVFLE